MMKSPVLSLLIIFPLSAFSQAYNTYRPPSSTDRRGPCPMVNTLANHGFLPRNGLNVSMDDLVKGFGSAINLAEPATRLVGAKALLTSTTGNNATFNLDDLNKHGIIEHDGSLSRNDIFFGDNHSFNRTIWATVASHFVGNTISIAVAAQARTERLAAAAAANPHFNMTSSDVQASLLETASYLAVFGSVTDGNAVTKHVKIMFEKQRLPYAEGWKRPSAPLTAEALIALARKVAAVTNPSIERDELRRLG